MYMFFHSLMHKDLRARGNGLPTMNEAAVLIKLKGWQRALYVRCSEAVQAFSLGADATLINFSLQFLRRLLCHPALAKSYLLNSASIWARGAKSYLPLRTQLLSLFEDRDLSMLKRDQMLALHTRKDLTKSQLRPSVGLEHVDYISSKLSVLRCLLEGIWTKVCSDDKVVIFSHSVEVLDRIKQMLHSMDEKSIALDDRVPESKRQVRCVPTFPDMLV